MTDFTTIRSSSWLIACSAASARSIDVIAIAVPPEHRSFSDDRPPSPRLSSCARYRTRASSASAKRSPAPGARWSPSPGSFTSTRGRYRRVRVIASTISASSPAASTRPPYWLFTRNSPAPEPVGEDAGDEDPGRLGGRDLNQELLDEHARRARD